MAWEDREGAGVLFRNKNKTKETQPDWKGTCLIHGEPAEVALWEKQGKRGAFFSFKIGPGRERREPDMSDIGGPSASALDDDAPF